MRNKKEMLFSENKLHPTAIGTGLVALDVVINGHNINEPYYMTGGSCGNVLIILSYLGWNSVPIGRLKKGNFSDFIIKDMKKWNVNTKYIHFDDKATTPIIIEKVVINNSDSTHKFSFYCPECNSILPRYRPSTIKQIDSDIMDIPKSYVCYIDRVSSGALRLAKACKDRGTIIFFEPTKIKDEKNFHEILKITDILKYSDDISVIDRNVIDKCNVPLIIETRGSAGLIYLLRNKMVQKAKWEEMKAFQVTKILDSAGSGDWCSAGLIHFLRNKKIFSIDQLDKNTLKDALALGQALAGLNCIFFGARGSMYFLSKEEFQQSVIDILSNGKIDAVSDISILQKPKTSIGHCFICNEKLER